MGSKGPAFDTTRQLLVEATILRSLSKIPLVVFVAAALHQTSINGTNDQQLLAVYLLIKYNWYSIEGRRQNTVKTVKQMEAQKDDAILRNLRINFSYTFREFATSGPTSII